MSSQTIQWANFSPKQKKYIKATIKNKFNVAEGAIRSAKTISNCIAAAIFLEVCQDRIHLASGSTLANAKMNIGDCNGFGLEHLFRGRSHWGKFKENQALYIQTKTGEKVVIFSGGGKADSYKKILGNSYGLWIATEINEHYDSDDSRESFIKVALGRQAAASQPKVLWDLNPDNPDARIYRDYIDLFKKQGLEGGYNYEHFVLTDNLSITEERLKEIKSLYNPNSLWYRRDILGERIILQGLCHQMLAENKEKYIIDKIETNEIMLLIVGVDFGGNQSATTFCATAFTLNFKKIVVIDSKRIKKLLTPVELEDEFINFVSNLYNKYGKSMRIRCDSEESVLISGLKVANAKRFGRCAIINALKTKIKNRILLTEKLVAKNKIYFLNNEGAKEVLDSLCKTTFDDNGERLDNVSYNNPVDMVDAFEYSIEEFTQELNALMS